jgi:APA family basic amino acid/polyamine antiporter
MLTTADVVLMTKRKHSLAHLTIASLDIHTMNSTNKLGPWGALALVAGTIIGTGIFIKAAVMAQMAGSITSVFLAWVVAALLSALGGLCYAELGSRFPKTGGEYVFLREGWSPWIAFLYGWTRFWIASPSAISAYAVGAATFASGFMDVNTVGGRPKLALLMIWTFTIINCFKVTFGGGVQIGLTLLKISMIFVIAAGVFLLSPSGDLNHLNSGPAFNPTSLFSPGFGAAVLAALWAFDGWNNMPMAASEIKDGQRNVPRALILGLVIVTFTYLIANAAWFYGVHFDEITTSNSTQFPDAIPVASKAVMPFWGPTGVAIVSVAFVLSAIGAMNGSIITSARVPLAMAEDALFPAWFATKHRRTGVPIRSMLIQGCTASALAASGTFDQLTDYVVFSSWIWYALAAAGLFKFRKTTTEFSGYKIRLFPVVPLLFIASSIWLMFQAIITNPNACLIGFLIITAGLPVYVFVQRKAVVSP